MNMQEIRDIAKERGIKSSRASKLKLIREIQISEGNFDCFATASSGECDQSACMWRDDCMVLSQKQSVS